MAKIYRFQYGGREARFTQLENAIAIRPTDALMDKVTSRAAAARLFGKPALDDVRGKGGLELPVRQKKHFEKAGWLFVDPHDHVGAVAGKQESLKGSESADDVGNADRQFSWPK